MIDFDSNIIIKDVATWMDGGSVTLTCKNDKEQNFKVHFVQNMIFEIPEDFEELPGRLYFNNELIEQRSDLERDIINSLEKKIVSGLGKLEKALLKEKLDYIKSEEYLKAKEKVKVYKRNRK
ncbi:hypothetical protein [uncultured Tenacibaculum sp.]|uniref:hypothetical protein n=1 Tax=uncultured Tenacibaculum sp. TaxID=174713 RepID=UPI0026121203|nr:hypothetical protein [uncultured Tenacibaculum sp.]